MAAFRPLFVLLLVIAPGIAAPRAVWAVTTYAWNNASGGSAATASNWAPPGVPTGSDPLVFDQPGTYTVTFGAGVSASYSQVWRTGDVTLAFAVPHTLNAFVTGGSISGDVSNVRIDGVLVAPLSSSLAGGSGTVANLRVSGPASQFRVTNPGADLRVGYFGVSRLDVDGGALVEVNDDLRIGEQAGAHGTVAVAGAGSTIRTLGASGDILVGVAGTGVLAVSGGGTATAGGALRVAANGTVDLEIRGSGAGAYDRVSASGAVTLGGTLRLRFPPGAALVPGQTMAIVTGSSIAGAFTTVDVTGFAHPEALVLTTPSTQLLRRLQPTVDAPATPILPPTIAFVATGATGFRLDLPAAADARVEVFDVRGRRLAVLAAGRLPAGSHALAVPTVPAKPGVFFGRATVRLVAEGSGAPFPVRELTARLVVR